MCAQADEIPTVLIQAAGVQDRAAVQELLGLGHTLTSEEVDPVLLAARNGELVGLIALHFTTMLHVIEPVVRITTLVVRDGTRGAGIGSVPVHAGDLARQSNCSLLELTTGITKWSFTDSSLRFSRPADGIVVP